MKVKKRTLLLIACLVWSAAGANILRIGIISYLPFVSLFNLLLSAAVFLLFDRMIFRRLVEKHTLRILSYPEERQMFLRFFDGKSFAIMAGMMSGGILLRRIPAISTQFIAVFYSGLGAALLLAGILFGVKFFTSSSHSSAA